MHRRRISSCFSGRGVGFINGSSHANGIPASRLALAIPVTGPNRNTFAHMLTGFYFDKDEPVAVMFTPETMDDTLYAIGTVAVMMEKIVFAGARD